MLLQEKKIKYNLPHFPVAWQSVVFRNYGLVPAENIAKVLSTTTDIIHNMATELGIGKITFCNDYLKKGYITIIKNNWHILSYAQLTNLLGWTESQLEFTLKEDDFLDVKLGRFKPAVTTELKYSPLTRAQKTRTKHIRDLVESEYITPQSTSFDFYTGYCGFSENVESHNKESERIIYSFSALYGDSLIEGTEESYPDVLLERLRGLNVNGIWMQGLLSNLSYYPFNEELCKGYKLRQKNLQSLIERCARYGIKIYLYLNEPRSLPEQTIEKLGLPKGHTQSGYSAICSHSEKTHDYLYTAVKELLTQVPDLGGIFTISMSENLTNCFSLKNVNCSCCMHLRAEDEVPRISNTMMRALRDSGSSAKLIANIWQWDSFLDISEEISDKVFANLDKDVGVMCISENGMKINKGGTDNVIIDYSLSNAGPSEKTQRYLVSAKKHGHEVYAKVQVNNSWECCAVPYIPVFDIIHEHFTNLSKLSLSGYLLSWTLGGYPSLSLSLVNRFNENKKVDLKQWYCDVFGENSDVAMRGVNYFSQAFKEFPFDLNFLYYGPQNLGCGNLWQFSRTGLRPTMVGFPYDGYKLWRGKYSIKVFRSQIVKLCNLWQKGMEIINQCKSTDKVFEEFKVMSTVCLIHFKSTLLQLDFALLKNKKNVDIERQTLITCENELTKLLYEIISKDSRIGFEPSNHYYYNANSLLEKLINLDYMTNVIKKKSKKFKCEEQNEKN